VRPTRRQFIGGAVALSAAAGLVWPPLPAFAQTVDTAKLLEAGPLGEEALGAADAPVTIVEYASLTCGHCAAFATQTFPALKTKYIDTGKVRFIMREFPLDPLAAAAFMLSRCAGEGKYFQMVDLFFEKQADWTRTDDPVAALLGLSKQAGFTQESFESCLTNQELLDGVNAVKDRGAQEFGVDSTPTFFVNGQVIRGAKTIAEFDAILEPLLK
jgi:protein-disulfide isomerase